MPDLTSRIQDVPLLDYLRVVRRRAWLILGVAALFTALASYVIFGITPRYTAVAIVETGSRSLTGSSDLLFAKSDANSQPVLRTELEIVNSEAEVLRSPHLAQEVVTRLHLLDNPDFLEELDSGKGAIGFLRSHLPGFIAQPLDALFGNAPGGPPTAAKRLEAATSAMMRILSLAYDGKSYIIKVGATTRNPQLSAAIANGVLQAYLDEERQVKLGHLEEADRWFKVNLARLQEKVVASDRAVEEFRTSHNLTETKGVTVVGQQLSQLNEALALASADRVQKETELGAWSNVAAHPGDISTYPGVLSSHLIQQLRDRQVELKRALADLQSQYGNAYPATIRARASLAEVDAAVKREVERIISGATAEVNAARAKENMLRQSVQKIEQASAANDNARVQLQALTREAEANRDLYRNLLERSKLTDAELSAQASTSRIVSQATPPLTPSYPKKSLMVAGAGLTGLMLGLIAAFMAEFMRDGFHGAEELARLTGVRTLGLVPHVAGRIAPEEEVLKRANSLYSESIHGIAALLGTSETGRRTRSVLVTSCLPGEGKTSVALSLARTLASAGQSCLFVDCDFRRSRVPDIIGRGAMGQELEPWLLPGGTSVVPLIVRDRSGLDCVVARTEHRHPHHILASKSFENFLWRANQHYEIVVIDAPPVLAVADALHLAPLCDDVLLVVRWDTTPRKMVLNALAALRQRPCRISGTVLTQVNTRRQGKYGLGDMGEYAKLCRDYYTRGKVRIEGRAG